MTADIDTRCIKPIHSWHQHPWRTSQNLTSTTPSMIVGIEVDVNPLYPIPNWRDCWPRPFFFTQWVFAGSRGHPVLIDMLRRASEAVNPLPGVSSDRSLQMWQGADRVLETTGPAAWTDSVLRCKLSFPMKRDAIAESLYARSWSEVQCDMADVTEYSR